MVDRISAVILKDKKILLVTGYKEVFYWTPGGKLDPKESHEVALKRELNEELKVGTISITPYFSYEAKNEINGELQKVHCYFATYEGDPKPQKEITRFIWYSKQNFLDKNPRVSEGIATHLIPKLIEDGIL